MKINPRVVKGFKLYCPTSTSKCLDESEIHYKIKRAVDIGKKSNGKAIGSYVVNYHNLEFYLKRTKNAMVVENIKFLRGSYKNHKYHPVNEQLKLQYDSIHREVSVVTKKEIKNTNLMKIVKEKVNVYKGFLKAVFR
jgi:hypothetical protein